MDTAQQKKATSPRLRGVIGTWSPDRIELLVPHTDYRLFVQPDHASAPTLAPGSRVRGIIEGEVIRVHPMTGGGGRYIEPVIGEPRIVTGVLRDMDAQAGVVVIEAVVPFRLATLADQDFGDLVIGGLVTCHVRSGLRLVLDPMT